jgi:zinc resistance-associated protein
MRYRKTLTATAIIASVGLFVSGVFAQQQGQPSTPTPSPSPQQQASPPSAPVPRDGGRFGYGPQGRWQGMSEKDRNAFFEARIAAIKAGLLLTDAQLKLWPPVETALRDMRKLRMDMAERSRKEGQSADPLERMKQAGETMSARGAAMTKMAEAMKPLHDSLTDEQKQRLRMLMRTGNGMMAMGGGGASPRGMHGHVQQGYRQHWHGGGQDRGQGMGGGRRGEYQQRWQHHHGWQGRGQNYGRGDHGPGWRQGMMEPGGRGWDRNPGRGWDHDGRGHYNRGEGRHWRQNAPDYGFGSRQPYGEWQRM